MILTLKLKSPLFIKKILSWSFMKGDILVGWEGVSSLNSISSTVVINESFCELNCSLVIPYKDLITKDNQVIRN